MQRWKVLRAADIGREFIHYGYKIEFIANVLFFISFWKIDSELRYTSNSTAMYVVYYLQWYTVYNLIFSLVKRIKKYDKQEKIAEIVDFLPMTRDERNLTNFLINYRKSLTLLIPFIFIFAVDNTNVSLRGLLILNFMVIIWTESIRNIFMKSGAAYKRRKAILLCDVIPVIFVIVSGITAVIYKSNMIIDMAGSFYVGLVLGMLSFAFMFYTAIKYKELINN